MSDDVAPSPDAARAAMESEYQLAESRKLVEYLEQGFSEIRHTFEANHIADKVRRAFQGV